MELDPAELDLAASYRLLSGLIVPRPIAWILTGSSAPFNVAPFSCFTFVSYDPMLIGFNCGRRNGELKDTAHNIRETGEFVLHIPSVVDRDLVHESSAPLPRGVSEVERLGLTTVPSTRIATPRLVGPKVAIECRLDRTIAFGRSGSDFIVGEVVAVHLAEGLMHDGKVDSTDLEPLARIAGPNYASLGDVFPASTLDASLGRPGSTQARLTKVVTRH